MAVRGTLKGYDPLLNLVLDDCVELLRDAEDPLQLSGQTRTIGLVVCRGTSVLTISPPGEQIDNPFADADEGQ